GQFLRTDFATVRGFVESLRKAKRDPRITSVLLMPSPLQLPFWGKVQELRDAVLDFRKSGKVVVAFLEYGGDREYYLASAADRVFLLPTSALDLAGVASYEVFLRGTFDKVGAYPDFLQIGAYKTAVNQLTQKSFTPAHREMTESLNGDMYEQLRRLREDDTIKAIVLRVDSPGGSSVASDVMWRELMITRDQKPSRPLITSMSDLAASGGYYISVPGQVIVAQPGTLTGSIGIFAGKIVIDGTLAKIGITTETVKSG